MRPLQNLKVLGRESKADGFCQHSEVDPESRVMGAKYPSIPNSVIE